LRTGICRGAWCNVTGLTAEQRLDDSRILVGQRDRGAVVPAPTDALQPSFTARGILAGHQTEPRCKLPAISELRGIADGADDCRGHNGPMPGMAGIFLHNVDCFMKVWIDVSMR
jgi:hypothetical protein